MHAPTAPATGRAAATDAGANADPVRVSAGDAPVAERRPDRRLLVLYALYSLALGPAFPIAMLVRWFKYRTLRYRFDEEGIAMRWGILFRREVALTYARIQDIHLVSNVVERWMGLGRVQIQTASASASAELTIEGLRDFEALRDYLYTRMRGVKQAAAVLPAAGAASADIAGLTEVLGEVASELRGLRELLQAREPQ
jgi:membrane protein YdbS with pleckstrin-like domain